MRGRMDLEPLGGRHLVGADDRAHLVVEDLGRRSRKRAETEVAEPRHVRLEVDSERRRALPDLERRERVHVDLGHGGLDRLDDARVVVAGERRVDPALEADLGGAALPCLAHPAHDFLVRHEVRRPAEVLGELALRERAEAAAEVADVRVLDVPRDDVRHVVAAHLATEPVGCGEDPLALLPRAANSRTSSSSPSSSPVSSSGAASRPTTNGTPTGSPGAQ